MTTGSDVHWVLLGYGPLARRVLEVSLAEDWPPSAIVTHAEASDLDTVSVTDVAKASSIECATTNPNEEGLSWLKALGPEAIFTVNYRRILKPQVLDISRADGFNVHGSLLPILRGRSPLTWSIILGHEQTGVTVHRLEAEVDTGDIVAQESIPIGPQDTSLTIQQKMLEMYPVLVYRTLDGLARETLTYRPQVGQATYGERRTPDDGEIDWTWSASRIYDWVRALTDPYPGAFTTLGGDRLYIWQVSVVESCQSEARPGSVIGRYRSLSVGDSWGVACGDGLVCIEATDPPVSELRQGVILGD